jgi:hypothetical protein
VNNTDKHLRSMTGCFKVHPHRVWMHIAMPSCVAWCSVSRQMRPYGSRQRIRIIGTPLGRGCLTWRERKNHKNRLAATSSGCRPRRTSTHRYEPPRLIHSDFLNATSGNTANSLLLSKDPTKIGNCATSIRRTIFYGRQTHAFTSQRASWNATGRLRLPCT